MVPYMLMAISLASRCSLESQLGCCQTCNYPYLKAISYVERMVVINAAEFVNKLDTVDIGDAGPADLQSYTIVNTKDLKPFTARIPCYTCVSMEECYTSDKLPSEEFIDECNVLKTRY